MKNNPQKPLSDRVGLENYGKVIKVTPKLRRQAEKVSKIFDEERLQRVVKASNRDQKAVMDNAEIMKEFKDEFFETFTMTGSTEQMDFIKEFFTKALSEKDKEIEIADNRWKANEECRERLMDMEVENQMEIDKAFDEGKKSKSMQIDEWMN